MFGDVWLCKKDQRIEQLTFEQADLFCTPALAAWLSNASNADLTESMGVDVEVARIGGVVIATGGD